MLLRKRILQLSEEWFPVVNIMALDSNLMNLFEELADTLNRMQDQKLPNTVGGFLHNLIMSTDPKELIHFAMLHNQRALYNTLREFIQLHIDRPDIPVTVRSGFLDIAAVLLVQAYCMYHEPNNMHHRNNRWSYSLCIDLRRVFKPFEVPRDQEGKRTSPARKEAVYEA